jgi:hypothetical protein
MVSGGLAVLSIGKPGKMLWLEKKRGRRRQVVLRKTCRTPQAKELRESVLLRAQTGLLKIIPLPINPGSGTLG